ncbi:MAG: glycosyltransferase [Candidatus Margulisbacteria bacterium]|nr:glycosyltransferase [Candidatus Margulisiibacteriota bacterium]
MKKLILFSSIVLIISMFIGLGFAANSMKAIKNSDKSTIFAIKSTLGLKTAIRQLGAEHVFYMRNYIISALAGTDDTEAVAKRLLKNQVDIGDAIKPYYGLDAGNRLTSLLTDHIMIAVDVVTAAKNKQKDSLKKAQSKWIVNAEEITTFLNRINPKWDKKMLTDELNMHLKLSTDEVVSRLNMDWTKDIESFDKIYNHMLKFADILSGGIIAQFPNKFTDKLDTSKKY